jgi:Fe-S oxidoreductase
MQFGFIEQVLIIVFILLTLGYFAWAMWLRLRMALSAAPDGPKEGPRRAAARFVKEVIFQSKVIRDRPISGSLHALVFWGFIFYIPVTIHHFLLPFTGGYLYGPIGQGYRAFMTVVSTLVAIAISGLAFRRFVLRPAYFEKKLSTASAIVSTFIFLLMVTFLLEPHAAHNAILAKANWWLHASCILLFLVVIPNGKHLHLVLGPFDLLMKRKRFGQVPPFVIDLENFDENMAFGIGKPADTSREMRLDSLSCVECGRCTEWCPANRIGKRLDPRSLIHSLEKPLLAGSQEPVFDGLINAEAVWQCVTCGACEHFCPLGIEHLPLILQYRRNLTLERTEIPPTMQTTFRSLQTKGNVWTVDREQRGESISSLGLPAYESGKLLIWSSCFFLTQEFASKVKRFADLLATAGIDAGISPLETCCGDPARKCGSEDLFQEIAAGNIAWMKEQGVKTVVSQCPHCLHTLSTAYPQVDPEFNVEVIHHSVLLARLLREGKLTASAPADGPATIHDPCYASRWKIGDVRAVREIARGAGLSPLEMRLSLERSYCCGSGGGSHHFFEDDDGKRIDDERIRQILATGASTVYTSCPFCFNMIGEGLKKDESAEKIKVEDITALFR